MKLRCIVSGLLLGAGIAAHAHAGMFDDEEARARIEALKRETAARFERMEAAQRQQIELSNQIEQTSTALGRLVA